MEKKNKISDRKQATDFWVSLPDLKRKSLAEFFETYNMMGYDQGDGEVSCSKVGYDANAGEPFAIPLACHAGSAFHVPNILAFVGENAHLVDSVQVGDNSRKIYQNFKRRPGRGSDKKYEHENGEKDSQYTYEDLMGHSFACTIAEIFERNPDKIDRKKPTIIMVGRPSGKGWEAVEQKYAEILGRFLKKYLPGISITILVLPESLAAMAGALGMKKDTWLKSFTQILDLGSSTFDITTVTPVGVCQEGEDSFQFGGNQLDKAMKEYTDYRFFKKYPREEGYAMEDDPRKAAILRFRKESCYGNNSENLEKPNKQNRYTYDILKNGEPDCDEWGDQKTETIPINATTMQQICTNAIDPPILSCAVKHPHPVLKDEIKECSSWEAACEFVMQQFYEKTKVLNTGNHPQRLILTGGVSNMRNVQEIAEKVFGVKAQQAPNPSLAVSNGLALILGWEIIKHSRLETLLGEMDELLPDAESLLKDLVEFFTVSDRVYYQHTIADWATGNDMRTLGECIKMIASPQNPHFDPYDGNCEKYAMVALENWLENHEIDKRIRKHLASGMYELLKDLGAFTVLAHPADFDDSRSVPMPALSCAPVKQLKNDYPLNIYMFFDKSNCPDDPYDLETPYTPAQRQEILRVYNKHQDDLINGGKFDCGKDYKVDIPGIRSIYDKQLTVNEDAAPLRSYILEILQERIREFVDTQTYYLSAADKQ